MDDFDSVPADRRLVNGAKLLGSLWRAGDRCMNGWSVGCLDSAPSGFCEAKAQWIELARETGRTISEEPFRLAVAMTDEELEATGMTLSIDIPEYGPVRLGPKGSMTPAQAAELAGRPAEFAAVMRVLGTFPGSKMVEIGLEAPSQAP